MPPSYAFRDRSPSAKELERIILALSTYRDGSGQVVAAGRSQPGWRDFERATASALGGSAPENKGVFDVVVAVNGGPLPYGLSLKTSAYRRGFVLMELHNSLAKSWNYLRARGIDPNSSPQLAGVALIDQVREWHLEVDHEIDVSRSSYLVLTHDRVWRKFQLSWYNLDLHTPAPELMRWEYTGRRIFATFDGHQYWEWYGESGGQLKYYPKLEDALWVSEPFELAEPPYEETPLDKAKRYWPDRVS